MISRCTTLGIANNFHLIENFVDNNQNNKRPKLIPVNNSLETKRMVMRNQWIMTKIRKMSKRLKLNKEEATDEIASHAEVSNNALNNEII